MTTEKRVKKVVFAEIVDVLKQYGTAEQVETMEHEIELLNRKRAKKEKPEDVALRNFILEYLKARPQTKTTCSMLMKAANATGDFEEEISLPKMSGALSKICGKVENPIPNALVKRTKVGRETYFNYVGE